MTLVSTELMYEGLEETFTHDFKDTATRTWLVTFDAPQSDPFHVFSAATGGQLNGNVPKRNTSLRPSRASGGAPAYAKSHVVRPMDGTRKVWTITISYAALPTTEFVPGGNPLQRRATRSIEFTTID